MIEHIWSVACTKSIIDRETNNITLSDVLEQVEAQAAVPRAEFPQGEPVLPIQFEIVSLWVRTDVDREARTIGRIMVQPPDAQPSPLGEPFDIDLSEYERLRTRSRFNGFPVSESGRYWFVVQKQEEADGWSDVARVPIVFKLVFPDDPR